MASNALALSMEMKVPNCNVRSHFGFLQSHVCPHVPHHKPTHIVLVTPFYMAGGHPPQEAFHKEQLTMLTDVCESDGSPRLSVSPITCLWKSVPF